MSGFEIHCTLYYITVTLRYTDFGQKPWRYTVFLKKNPLQYISINLMKHGFEMHGFFLDPKSAHLKALL